MPFVYQLEPDLTAAEFQDILIRSGLDNVRPVVSDLDRLDQMLRNAQIVLTCRNEDKKLIGFSRAITDYAYCTYLSELAVDKDNQCNGIGTKLMKQTHEIAGLQTSLILLSASDAAEYYNKIGVPKENLCFVVQRNKD